MIEIPQMFSIEISSIYIALCGILMILLAINVVRGRIKSEVGIGDGGDADFNRIIRAHGNFTEYVPIALLLLVAVENSGVSDVFVHTLGSVLVVARILHPIGLYKTADASIPRFLGNIGTWLAILVPAVTLLMNAL